MLTNPARFAIQGYQSRVLQQYMNGLEKVSTHQVQISKEHIPSVFISAKSMADSGAYHKAADLFERIITLDPSCLPAIEYLAKCHYECRNYAKAKDVIDIGRKQDSLSLSLLVLLAKIFIVTDQKESAVIVLQKAAQHPKFFEEKYYHFEVQNLLNTALSSLPAQTKSE